MNQPRFKEGDRITVVFGHSSQLDGKSGVIRRMVQGVFTERWFHFVDFEGLHYEPYLFEHEIELAKGPW